MDPYWQNHACTTWDGETKTSLINWLMKIWSKSWNSTLSLDPAFITTSIVMLPHFSKSRPQNIIFKYFQGVVEENTSQVLPENCPNNLQVVVKYHLPQPRWSSTTFDPARFPYFPLEPTGCRGLLEEPRGFWKLVSFLGGECCLGRFYAIVVICHSNCASTMFGWSHVQFLR